MKLTSRTGVLNLLVTAKDPESGIRTLEVWVNKKTTTCDAGGVCQTTAPGLQTKPRYENSSPQKNPGDTTPASSVIAQALDLSTEIGQTGVPSGGSLTISLILHAVATNHLGGRTQTPDLVATWSQP
jgi:hypothetical protein